MSNDLRTLMWEYSKRGMEDWKNDAASDLQELAREHLAHAIVEDEWELGQVIDGRSGEPKFIPMPKRGDKGFEWSFFLPTKEEGNLKSLILLLLVKPEEGECTCVAFRFESSPRGSHGYSHVQLTSKLKKSGLSAQVVGGISCFPEWFPTSYPAFPVPARNWTGMFLSMATAIHGREGEDGIYSLLREIFQGTMNTNAARKYKDMLDEILSKLDADS